jgi:hypothetical protein
MTRIEIGSVAVTLHIFVSVCVTRVFIIRAENTDTFVVNCVVTSGNQFYV